MVIRLRYKWIFGIGAGIVCAILLLVLLTGPLSTNVVTDIKDAVKLPIFMYHEVKNKKSGKDAITPAELEADFKYLNDNHFNTITMAQLIAYVYDNIPLPENPIIITFDDGYLSTYVNVLPLLKQYNIHIVFSIIGKNADDFTKRPDSNIDYSHATWEQINEMVATGLVEVQNHTYNLHANKGRIGCKQCKGETLAQYEKVMHDDIGMLQDLITQKIGITPTTFTYPYGLSSKYTDMILREMGFKATLSCTYGINQITKEPSTLYGLKRVCRSHDQSLQKLLKEVLKTIRPAS